LSDPEFRERMRTPDATESNWGFSASALVVLLASTSSVFDCHLTR
jgi:hypothetical protein